MRYLTVFAAASFAIAAGPAQAQSTIGADMAMGNLHNELLQRRLKEGEAAAPITIQQEARLTFRPSPQRRQANVERLLDSLRRTQPAVHEELSALGAQGKQFDLIGGAIAPYGLSTDNIGDAYAYWWIHAWLAWAGDTSDQTPEQVAAVARQAGAAVAATPAMAAAADAQKQDLADQLYVQGSMISIAIEQMKIDPSTKPQWRAAMAQSAREAGLDFAAMRLTPTGFVATDATSPGAGTRAKGAQQPAAAIASDMSHKLIDRVIFYQWGDLQFHPTVLLKDGSAFEVDDASLEAEPPARSRSLHPQAWGKWRGAGDSLVITEADGGQTQHTIGNGVYLGFPASGGQTLSGTYQSVSGMQVGEISMLNSGRLTFSENGRFTSARDFAASGSGDYSGTSMAGGSSWRGGGTYALSGHRIVLTRQDGTVQDLFFAFGATGQPQRPDADMIFLGDTAWVRED